MGGKLVSPSEDFLKIYYSAFGIKIHTGNLFKGKLAHIFAMEMTTEIHLKIYCFLWLYFENTLNFIPLAMIHTPEPKRGIFFLSL